MKKYESIVVLTGAGISQESGLPTFRGADGLWEGHRVEDVATPEAFERDPELVLEFYNQRRRHLLSGTVEPRDPREVSDPRAPCAAPGGPARRRQSDRLEDPNRSKHESRNGCQ